MSSAPRTPAWAFGLATPAKKMANATGMVTRAASQAVLLTRVPMMRAALPVSARPRCATALFRLVPPNETSTRVAKLPNTANNVICGSPMTWAVSANRPGITRVARTARIAAGTDQTGSQPGRVPGRVSRHLAYHGTRCRSRSGPAGEGSFTDSAIPWSLRFPARWQGGGPCPAAQAAGLAAGGLWLRRRPGGLGAGRWFPSGVGRQLPGGRQAPGLGLAAEVGADLLAEPAGLPAVERRACHRPGEQRGERERAPAHAPVKPPPQ